MRYAVLIERGETSWAATVPDLPGLFIVAETREELEDLIQSGIRFHIESLIADGDPVPEPTLQAHEVEVA